MKLDKLGKYGSNIIWKDQLILYKFEDGVRVPMRQHSIQVTIFEKLWSSTRSLGSYRYKGLYIDWCRTIQISCNKEMINNEVQELIEKLL